MDVKPIRTEDAAQVHEACNARLQVVEFEHLREAAHLAGAHVDEVFAPLAPCAFAQVATAIEVALAGHVRIVEPRVVARDRAPALD